MKTSEEALPRKTGLRALGALAVVAFTVGIYLTRAESPPGLRLEVLTNAQVRLAWTNAASGFVVEEVEQLATSNAWQTVFQAPSLAGQQYSVVLSNATGNRFFRLTTRPGGLPPDPSLIAAPVAPTVAAEVGTATAFLYTGSNAIQTGVTNGTIEARRAAVIRGKVKLQSNTPLSGVGISVFGHPEFGQTQSRADGRFDLAVNGGSTLVLKFEKVGFLPVQRQIEVPWQDFRCLEDAVLIPVDAAVATVGFGTNSAQQVAQGTVQTDADGARRGTLVFPTGTEASLVMPNGTTQAVNSLNIRVTEYTVGSNGPAAMPAQLPPSSAYTYCVELSADEAMAVDATSVQFSQPVCFYVENFLNFPVGQKVPVGFYDRQKAVWVPSQNGRVIKVLSLSGGLAVLDTDGDGLADNAGQLAALGITDAERQRLATLYGAGQTLWRSCITHFSPWDCNWPGGPPAGAKGPSGSPSPKNPPPNPCKSGGSIISVETQSLGEDVNVVGTPYRLHYESERVAGHKASYTIEIPLTEATLPPNLKRVTLNIEVAGRLTTQDFPATPNQTTSFTWDGLDAYGRFVPGKQPVTVRIGYVYDAVYYEPADFEGAFAAFADSILTPNPGRGEVTLWKYWTGLAGQMTSDAVGLGGWTLNVHHYYDPRGKILYMGDGTWRSPEGLETTVINLFAGSAGPSPNNGDGGPATSARVVTPSGMAFGPDGSLYITEALGNRVRRVFPDGTIVTVAGSINGSSCFPSTNACGDGGPATLALMNNPQDVTVAADGTFYVADRSNSRIRKVDTNGIMTTVAGTGDYVFNGDGGPATQANISSPYGVAIGPDGNLYFADTGNNRIRKVDAQGIITTVAGGGSASFPDFGDGGPASQCVLSQPLRLAFGPDGSLYVIDWGHYRVRRITPDGIIRNFAGAGGNGGTFSGDGGPAEYALFGQIYGIAVAPDGNVYLSDYGFSRVRMVDANGIINTIAGTGASGFVGDGGPAKRAAVGDPGGLALGPDHSLYVASDFYQRVRRITSALPGFSLDEKLLTSEDGMEVYVFSNGGRHLRTVDALTQAVRYQFGYDANGRLASITDGDGNLTTVERDASGQPTGMLGPYGQRTELTVNDSGYLATIKNPANEQTSLSYGSGGLLTSFTDARTNSWTVAYDAAGRLTLDADPVGGFKMLSRSEASNGFSLALSTALARTNRYEVASLTNGARLRTYTFPTGEQAEYEERTDGSIINRFPDGSVSTVVLGPDPRWSMLAPVEVTNMIVTPGGLTNLAMAQRSATLSNVADPFSLISWSETNSYNGRKYSSVYRAASRALTNTTPKGRKLTATFDSQLRPVREELVGLHPTFFTYDNRGRISSVVRGTGAEARTNTLGYDSNGYLTNSTDPLGRQVTLGYDLAGRIISQVFPDGRPAGFAYDANGNRTSVTPPGRPPHGLAYNAVNLESLYAPPTAVTGTNSTQYAYNADRELTLVTRPDGQTVSFDYSSGGCNCGRLNSMTQPRGTTTYSYDPITGNPFSIVAPDGINLTFAYDGPLLISETWTGPVSGSVGMTYDNDFRLLTQTVNGSNAITRQYDLDNLLVQAGALTLTNDVQTGLPLGGTVGVVSDTWSYNGFAEPTNHVAVTNSADLYAARYTRDAVGRIVGLTEIISGVTNIFTYTYDLSGQLTNVTQNGATVASYSYDSNNNRLATTDSGGTFGGTYDNQDRVTQYGMATFGYTANGELQSKTNGAQVTTYQYDPFGNLIAATLPGGTSIQYLIDGRDRRIGRKVNNVLAQGFLYDGQLTCVAELDGAGAVVSRFVYGRREGAPEYMIKSGITYRIITDHLGSVRLVVDSSTGQIAQRMDYDAFGQVLSDTSPGFQPFGFAGGLYDGDTKLVRFGARDYDPATGRWTAKDPILFAGRQANLYTYVNNDPLNRVDRDGLDWSGPGGGGGAGGGGAGGGGDPCQKKNPKFKAPPKMKAMKEYSKMRNEFAGEKSEQAASNFSNPIRNAFGGASDALSGN